MNYKSMAAGYAIHWKENQQLAPLQRVNGCGFNGRIYGTHTHSHSQTTALLNTSHYLRSECEVKLIWVEEEYMYVQRRRCRCRCACVCVCVCVCAFALADYDYVCVLWVCAYTLFWYRVCAFRGWLASVSVSSCYRDNECVPPLCHN